MDEFEAFHPITNAVLILLAEHNPCVFDSLCRQVDKVSVVRAENVSHLCGTMQVIDVGIPARSQSANGHRLNAARL